MSGDFRLRFIFITPYLLAPVDTVRKVLNRGFHHRGVDLNSTDNFLNEYPCKGYGMLLKIPEMTFRYPKQLPGDEDTGEFRLPGLFGTRNRLTKKINGA
jgi:hypothetical protein